MSRNSEIVRLHRALQAVDLTEYQRGYLAGQITQLINPPWRNWYVVRTLRRWRSHSWRNLRRQPFPHH